MRTPAMLPARMPRFGDTLLRRTCRGLLRLCGWRLRGEFPDIPRLVMIGAPHSSWWDGIWALLMKVAVGANVHFMGKQELFVGPLGWLLRRMGGMPIDRGAGAGVVEQMVAQFQRRDALWLGLTPEGTRKTVKRWKSGFWHIAHRAGVPILAVAFDYPRKTFHVSPLFTTSDDMHADIARLRAWYVPFHGKHHSV